ncbi:MAG: sugar phosphate nucleotidyltransferase, partial [Desulfomonilaceae bacterium]
MTTKLPITAFILAGGMGSRLKPVVWDRPKPLAPIGQKPFLEILIDSIIRKGIQSIVLLTGFMSEQIEDFVLKYGAADISIVISREESPLGTGGAVKNAQEFATDPTLLVNGDTYFEADIAGLY